MISLSIFSIQSSLSFFMFVSLFLMSCVHQNFIKVLTSTNRATIREIHDIGPCFFMFFMKVFISSFFPPPATFCFLWLRCATRTVKKIQAILVIRYFKPVCKPIGLFKIHRPNIIYFLAKGWLRNSNAIRTILLAIPKFHESGFDFVSVYHAFHNLLSYDVNIIVALCNFIVNSFVQLFFASYVFDIALRKNFCYNASRR